MKKYFYQYHLFFGYAVIVFFNSRVVQQHCSRFFCSSVDESNPTSICFVLWWNDLSVTLVTCFPLKMLLWSIVFYCQNTPRPSTVEAKNGPYGHTLLHYFVAFFFYFVDAMACLRMPHLQMSLGSKSCESLIAEQPFRLSKFLLGTLVSAWRKQRRGIKTSEYVFSIVWFTFMHTTSPD